MNAVKFSFILIMLGSSASNATEARQQHKDKVIKRLYLVRHAKSSHEDITLMDFDRPLNERGKRDAPLMGARLHQLGVRVDHILSSPSRRTRQTAKFLCEKLHLDFEKIDWDQEVYACSSRTLQQRIRAVDHKFNNIMVFGHNPSMTAAANFFQKDTLFENVPTTGVVAIEFEIASWAELDSVKGKLLFFERPKKRK